VDLYTRRQLTLLLVVVLVAAAGIGIDRWRRGSFGSVDELRRVRGIGDTTLARVRPLLAVGPAP
jgi:DNA uptake protein ComE-like DNA-binding protein